MVIPPILDVFVVWHPDDVKGEEVCTWLEQHFHSPAFAGLAGGAVEVYARSTGWGTEEGPPRPLGIESRLAGVLPAAQFNVIVPVLGANLMRAVEDDPEWHSYMANLVELDGNNDTGVYPVRIPPANVTGKLAQLVSPLQALAEESIDDAAVLARELCQAITQRVSTAANGEPGRVRVFISHTKHFSLEEPGAERGPALFEEVRKQIENTRLASFFDAQDLQAGSLWEIELDRNAAACALLMVRTDKYSGREWTQREVLVAKRAGVPIVGMYAFTAGEERGSFLMDHVPSVPCDAENPLPGIQTALNRLVDEALKRTLWEAQSVYLKENGFDWLPVHAPEPVTLAPWLAEHKQAEPEDPHVWIIHPDPPLGPRERDVVVELCALAGFTDNVDVLTPRTFAARGGRVAL
ncbi:toll/interleukin-1 receptor domain-containing protein [Rhodococcus pyridinivorans]|uniref:toll/interleukin-1 receptor domain-containing protein n=1 Tax=Rhodococcus pyridinivorans TaxID=103816 RepID=UPI0020C748F5|nr:toll/interleukin-1 receptor domain-containing protein [Rhodococcus pyridinivorans]